MIRHTILLVDDDADFLAMNRSVLVQHGYQVETASSGEGAMEKIRTAHPDLVVTDVMMSSLDSGFTLARMLKDDRRTAAIPVIIATAASSQRGYDFRPRTDDDMRVLGADVYLDKPVSPEVLVAKIRELLSRSGKAPA